MRMPHLAFRGGDRLRRGQDPHARVPAATLGSLTRVSVNVSFDVLGVLASCCQGQDADPKAESR